MNVWLGKIVIKQLRNEEHVSKLLRKLLRKPSKYTVNIFCKYNKDPLFSYTASAKY